MIASGADDTLPARDGQGLIGLARLRPLTRLTLALAAPRPSRSASRLHAPRSATPSRGRGHTRRGPGCGGCYITEQGCPPRRIGPYPRPESPCGAPSELACCRMGKEVTAGEPTGGVFANVLSSAAPGPALRRESEAVGAFLIGRPVLRAPLAPQTPGCSWGLASERLVSDLGVRSSFTANF